MATIGIRELRADLAAAVRRAGSGERLVVTVDGRPVAVLGPLTPDGPATLADLAARGLVSLPARADRPPPAVEVSAWAGLRLDRILRDVR